MATDIDFQISAGQAFIKSPAQARNKMRNPSIVAIATAKVPLFGFGTFVNTVPTIGFGTTESTSTAAYGLNYNLVWPYVYAKCVEFLNEGVNTTTITTIFQPYSNIFIQSITTTGSGANGGYYTAGSDTYSITPTVYTSTYQSGSGTYTATLSGSILNPTGLGPFNPSDATYGWKALTATANSILSLITFPSSGQILDVFPTSTGTTTTGPSAIQSGASIADFVVAAANGFPEGPWNVPLGPTAYMGMPPSIADFPSPLSNSQRTNNPYPDTAPIVGATTVSNSGYCVCTKSKWVLNGATWFNSAAWTGGGGGAINPILLDNHTHLYGQSFDITNFNSGGTVSPATTFGTPLPWPSTITFMPSDVLANISGSYGLLGFQSVAA